ncbi:MAG: Uma2 family endonuclease [Cyclobacteriaceae bacterium]
MKANLVREYTIEEYSQIEEETGIKHEYHQGEVYAMSGGTIAHGMLCGNSYAILRSSLRGKEQNCTALNSEIKLHITAVDSFVYPDAMVVCGPIERSDKDKNAVTNPIVIIEVLSKTTSDYDPVSTAGGDKFYQYRQVSSLLEYVLISQEKAVVEVYSKQPNTEFWKISHYEGWNENIMLSSITLEVSMSDLYEGIEEIPS